MTEESAPVIKLILFFVANIFSSECVNNCANCTGADAEDCIRCENPFYLTLEGTCVANCGLEYFADPLTNSCEACLSDCSICTDAATCTSCNNGAFLNGDGTCALCGEGCSECANATTCSFCSSDYLLEESTGQCVTECQQTDYTDNLQKTCSPCDQSCSGCSGTSATLCSQCAEGFYQQNETSLCVADCGDKNYGDDVDMTCKRKD